MYNDAIMRVFQRTMLVILIIILITAAGILTFYLGFTTSRPAGAERSRLNNRKIIKNVAEMYLETGNYSEEGLIKTLHDYEWCDEKVAREVITSMDIDWQSQADEELNAYLGMTGISEMQIRDYLKRDQFTQDQINMAIEEISPDWSRQAQICADYLRSSGIDDSDIEAALLDRGFRQEELQDLNIADYENITKSGDE